jgi:zinc protease
MKKILITAILCLAVRVVFAQAATTAFYVDGIKVIFKPTVKEMINARVYFKGGVSNYTANNAGIENFALSATTECGTKKYTGDAFRDTADNNSINIGSESTYDYGDIQMQCISKYFDQGWDLFAEAVVNPVFDAGQLELLRNKVQAGVAQMQSDPDKYIERLMIKNAFTGTAYETDPNGTAETLSRFTAADLKAYYKSILNKNQIFIVVAGKISKQELIAKIHASFAGLPSRPYTPPVYKTPVWNDYKVFVEKRDISTNYISAIMNSPQVASPDYVPFELGISVLSGSLFSDLRSQLNLSYDPGADAVMRKMPYSTMTVSTTRPKEAAQELVKVLKLVKQYGISAEGLKQLKSSYITTNYMKQQSTSAVTGNLGEAEIYGGWETAEQLPERINAVTVAQIDAALNKYLVGLRWTYLGNAAQADEAAEAFKGTTK